MKVLYIAGAGRSGSTLIEQILGNLPGFFSVGEIRHFWEYYLSGNVLCGCGELLNECPIWSKAIEHAKFSQMELDEIREKSLKIDRTRNLLQIAMGLYDQQSFQELKLANEKLYKSLFELSGAEIIVDSSKVPSHQYLLSQITDIGLLSLHLIRDGRAVAYSWNKHVKIEHGIKGDTTYMPHRATYPSLIRWAAENLFTTIFNRNLANKSFMRYEDFTQHPSAELKRVFAELQIDQSCLDKLAGIEQQEIRIRRTHSVGGNPLRFENQSIQIRTDQNWKNEISKSSYFWQGLLISPVLKAYGYSI